MTTALHKSISSALRKGAGSNGTPSADQVKLINGLTLRDFTDAELYTREFVIAHNGIDRDREVIDEALLERFAKTLPGKGMFIKHPMSFDGDSGPGEGRWYAARTETMSLESAKELLREPEFKLPPDRKQVTVLFGSVYLVRSPVNADLLTKIDGGIASDVSIGFSTSGRADVLDPATNAKVATRLLGPGDAFEASLVWLGAQPGARAIKTVKDNAMDLSEMQTKLTKAESDIAAMKAQLETFKAAAAKLDALKAAFGAQAELLDNPTQLVAHVEAGKAFTNELIDGIVAADRLAKRCGDTPEQVAAHRAMYAAMPTPALKHLHGALVQTGTGATLAPSDPNASKATPPTTETKGLVPDALNFDA